MSDVPNLIVTSIRCAHCSGIEPRKLAIGFTLDGRIQVWCERHDCHVAILPLLNPPAPADLICDECGQSLGPHHKPH